MKKILFTLLAVLTVFAGQAISAPNLFVNGSSSALSPAVGNYSDLGLNAYSSVDFTLLFEQTSYSNRNSLFLHHWGSNSVYRTIFDDNDDVGDTRSLSLNGFYGFSLFSDANDNGYYNSSNDKWLFSDREYTRPNSMPDDNYQFFRGYNTGSFGYANYRFENGNLRFSGNYDFLLFIDDRQAGNGNYDHNDMVVGGRFRSSSSHGGHDQVPEPATLVLLGVGLAGAGIVRKFRK